MDKFELQRLRDLPIEGVAERLGLRVERHKSLCPFHEDRHPSMSYRVSKNTCRCFVCMTQSIGTIDLVMRLLGKDFREACRWLADEHNVILTDESSKVRDSGFKSEPSPFDASRYERFFEHPWLSEAARRFLFEERRLDPRVVSWCRLTSWQDKHGTPWLQIPYYNKEGKLVGVQNRNLRSRPPLPPQRGELEPAVNNPQPPSGGHTGGCRFRFPRGSRCGIYNLPILNYLQAGDELYITEGCSDCWAMLSAGHKAIAIPSATLLTRQDIELLSTLNSKLSTEFHMFPDRDEPGERLFLQLQQVLPSLIHHHLPPDCKDFSDYYTKMQPALHLDANTNTP